MLTISLMPLQAVWFFLSCVHFFSIRKDRPMAILILIDYFLFHRKRPQNKMKKSPVGSWRSFFNLGKSSSVSKRKLQRNESEPSEMKAMALKGECLGDSHFCCCHDGLRLLWAHSSHIVMICFHNMFTVVSHIWSVFFHQFFIPKLKSNII